MKTLPVVLSALCLAGVIQVGSARADVTVLEQDVARDLSSKEKARQRRGARATASPQATGSQALIDNSHLEWFINTNITFTTSSSASGAVSEASYTQAVNATTANGGTVATTLNDAFDGYNALCVSLNNSTGPCSRGGPNYAIYNNNGPATTECDGRQVVLSPQTIGPLTVQRKIFVPTDDAFARWLNIFTNTSGGAVTFTMVTSNNLGSDSNTRIVSSSSGDASVTTADTWATTFQNYSGTTSSDPRIGHVFGGTGAPVGLTNVNFADGDDNPFWAYSLTLAAGETRIIANFATGQPSKAAANEQAAALATFPLTARQCLSTTEMTQIANFLVTPGEPPPIPTLSETAFILLTLLLLTFGLWRLSSRSGPRPGVA